MGSLERGYVQVYTGDGKGKTTAALGLALRAVGAGLRVYIGQFVKGMHYSELNALEVFGDRLIVRQFGRRCFITGPPEPEDIAEAGRGLKTVRTVMAEGKFDLVVLDEANIAVHFGLFSARELLEAVQARAPHVEVVITGRRAPQEVIEYADLVTEMRMVKHYYEAGVPARNGIEK